MARRLQQIAQHADMQPEHRFRASDVADRPREVGSPWLTTQEACDYLRFRGKHRLRSLYRFLDREGIPVGRRSARTLLVARLDLDRALRGRR